MERGWIGSEYYYQAKSVHDFMDPLGEARDEKQVMIDLNQIMKDRGLVKYDLIPWKTSKEFYEFRLKDTGFTLEDLKEKQIIMTPLKFKEYEEWGSVLPRVKRNFTRRCLRSTAMIPSLTSRSPCRALIVHLNWAKNIP